MSEFRETTENGAFCVIPFVHMNTTTGGLYKACCIMDHPLKGDDGKPLTLYGNTLEQAWNSQELKDIRSRMLRGEKPAHCKKCYYEESHGSRSLRKDYTENWLRDESRAIEERVRQARASGGHISEAPCFVELKFSNLCNIKCRMCSPFDSSQVKKEYEQIAGENKEFDDLWQHRHQVLFNPEMKLNDLPVWYENGELFGQFLKLIPELKQMHFAGGEPTLHQQFYELLDLAVASGYAGQISLSFNTNLTRLSDALLVKLGQFKHVSVHASLDGYGRVQEYVRYPTQWGAIRENLHKLAKTPASVQVLISPTVQIYNVFELPELFRFINGLSAETGKQMIITPGILDYPEYFNVRILPPELRRRAAALWRDYAASVREDWFRERMNTVAAVIEDENFQINEELLKKFKLVTGLVDAKRGQNFAETFPELSAGIDEALARLKQKAVDEAMAEQNLARTVRFLSEGRFSDHTPEHLISRGLNAFKGWSCSAGSNGLFIDWRGQVYPGTCMTGRMDSYGSIETGFQLKKDWFVCSRELCHCNIEITLPKFRRTGLSAEGLSAARESASQTSHETGLPAAVAITSPEAALPALHWDRNSKYVMWAIGRRCNYSCSYCDDNSHSKTDPFFSREVLFKTIEHLHREYAGGKVIRYAFTGGEPTLHPDYLDLVKAIHAQGHMVGTTSNGSRTADYYCELLKYSTLNFSVHFEFVNEDRFFRMLEKLVEFKKSGEYIKMWVDIRFMVKPGGFERARGLLERLRTIPDFDKMIIHSFVPIRRPNEDVMMDYAADELEMIQKGMA